MKDAVMNKYTKEVGKYLGFMACYIQMLGIFCYTKKGDISGYASVVLPMTFIMLFFLVFAVALRSQNLRYTMLILVLTGLGTVMQVLVGNAAPYRYMAGRMLSLAAAVLCLGMCVLSQKLPKGMQMFLYISVILILSFMSLRFGLTLNGSRAWIGWKDPETDTIRFSLQVTELIKIFVMLLFAVILGNERRTKARRFKGSFGILALSTVICGLYMKEFGTVLVLFLTWILAVYLLLDQRYCLCAMACIAGISIGILGIARFGAGMAGRIPEEMHILKKLCQIAAAIWNKFSHRMELKFHLEDMDASKAPYQLLLSRKALRLAGLFGNSRSFYDIPVQSSDMVYSMILLRMGLILAVIIMLFFLWAYRETFVIAFRNQNPVESCTVICFSTYMVVQTLLSMFSSQGFFLLVGLPVCLFSSGKTQEMVTLGMILYVIYAGRGRRGGSWEC